LLDRQVGRPGTFEYLVDASAAGAVSMAGPGWRNRNRVGAESLQSPTEKAGHRQATVVDQQFDIGHPRMIIDRDMQALPTKLVMDIHVPRVASLVILSTPGHSG